MSTITTILGTDKIKDSRAVINQNFANLNNDKVETLADLGITKTATEINTTVDNVTTAAEKSALSGGGSFGTPSGSNKFVTEQFITNQTVIRDAFQQSIPALTYANAAFNGFTASSDGSAFYLFRDFNDLVRYERDVNTGMYHETHAVTTSHNTGGCKGLIVIGSFLYIFTDNGQSDLFCFRYNASDLTNQTTMTMPTIPSGGSSSNTSAWTDGVDAYIVQQGADTTSRRLTLSGTTFSAAGTTTVTTGIFARNQCGTMWDGTNAYLIDNSSSTQYTIRKLTNINGSSVSTTTRTLRTIGGADTGALIIPIDSTRIYVGKISNNFNATADVGSSINLFPITRP